MITTAILTSITGTSTPWYSQTFGYDELNRLIICVGALWVNHIQPMTMWETGSTRNTNGVVESYACITARIEASIRSREDSRSEGVHL